MGILMHFYTILCTSLQFIMSIICIYLTQRARCNSGKPDSKCNSMPQTCIKFGQTADRLLSMQSTQCHKIVELKLWWFVNDKCADPHYVYIKFNFEMTFHLNSKLLMYTEGDNVHEKDEYTSTCTCIYYIYLWWFIDCWDNSSNTERYIRVLLISTYQKTHPLWSAVSPVV